MNILKNPTRVAFTLIELIVVVAIIAIMASILLPALSQARGRAQATVCASNLKQMTLAATMYADDNESWLPYNGLKQSTHVNYLILMVPYIGQEVPGMSNQITHAKSPDKYYPVFRCPTTFEYPRTQYYNGSYGYNMPSTTTTGNGGNDPTTSTYHGRARQRMDRLPASQTVMFADSYHVGLTSFGVLTISQTGFHPTTNTFYPDRVRAHAGGRLNLALYDGSVSAMQKGQRSDLLIADSKSKISGASLLISGW